VLETSNDEVRMRGPKPTPVVLTDTVCAELEQVTRRHTTPQQIALRARIILAAADGLNHTMVSVMVDDLLKHLPENAS
jgi:rRNA-processing protein FCF1